MEESDGRSSARSAKTWTYKINVCGVWTAANQPACQTVWRVPVSKKATWERKQKDKKQQKIETKHKKEEKAEDTIKRKKE